MDRLKPLCESSEIELCVFLRPVAARCSYCWQSSNTIGTAFSRLERAGKPAETVAEEAVAELDAFLKTDGCLAPYLADQAVVPLAIADGVSEVRTSKITLPLLTNIEVVKLLFPVKIGLSGEIGWPSTFRVSGASVKR